MLQWGLHVRYRSHGRKRAYFYACTSYFNKGETVCHNGLQVRMDAVDAAVLEATGGQVLAEDVVREIVDGVCEALAPTRRADDLKAVERSCQR